jgi:hypothetical protein
MTRYFDLERGEYSQRYRNAIVGYGLVAHIAYDDATIVVHDIFYTGRDFNVFKPNVWRGKRYDLSPENTYQFSVLYPYNAIEFLDETHLQIEYLDANEQFVKETLEFLDFFKL